MDQLNEPGKLAYCSLNQLHWKIKFIRGLLRESEHRYSLCSVLKSLINMTNPEWCTNTWGLSSAINKHDNQVWIEMTQMVIETPKALSLTGYSLVCHHRYSLLPPRPRFSPQAFPNRSISHVLWGVAAAPWHWWQEKDGGKQYEIKGKAIHIIIVIFEGKKKVKNDKKGAMKKFLILSNSLPELLMLCWTAE